MVTASSSPSSSSLLGNPNSPLILVCGGWDERRAYSTLNRLHLSALPPPFQTTSNSSSTITTTTTTTTTTTNNQTNPLTTAQQQTQQHLNNHQIVNTLVHDLLAPLHEARYAHAVCVTPDDKVVAVGGIDGRNFLRTAEIFTNNKWSPLPKLQFSRAYLGVCSLSDGRVVALGGESGKLALNSVELYQPDKKNWRVLPPMMQNRQSCAAASLGLYVYALGGRDESGSHGKILKSCEMLNSSCGGWKPIKPMKQARSGLAATSYKGRIYVVGGTNGVKVLNSVEVYHPHLNSWTSGPSLSNARAYASLVIWNNCIVCIGGRETTAQETVDNVEIWSPSGDNVDEGRWEDAGKTGLGKQTWFYAAASLHSPTLSDCFQPCPVTTTSSPSTAPFPPPTPPLSSTSLPIAGQLAVTSPGTSVAAVAAKFGFVRRKPQSESRTNPVVAADNKTATDQNRKIMLEGVARGYSVAAMRHGAASSRDGSKKDVTIVDSSNMSTTNHQSTPLASEATTFIKRADGLEVPRMKNLLPTDVLQANKITAGGEGEATVHQSSQRLEVSIGDDDERPNSSPSDTQRKIVAASKVDRLRAAFEQQANPSPVSPVQDPMAWFEQ